MAIATLTIDLAAIVHNWRLLANSSHASVATGAVVKADAYGLGVDAIVRALAAIGVRHFFVALTHEGVVVRKALGGGYFIYVFSGLNVNTAADMKRYNLIPLLNSPQQVQIYKNIMLGADFGVQLNSGMNRLGMQAEDFATLKHSLQDARLVISHLACADEKMHWQNQAQLAQFRAMTESITASRSLAATAGMALGGDYHFDLCRPGIGLYGGVALKGALPVVRLDIPIIQTRKIRKGAMVGYGATWKAKRDSLIATLSAGYADGIMRAMGNNSLMLYANTIPCPMVGRVSMDLITVDITDLAQVPRSLSLLNHCQTITHLANMIDTIDYEILTLFGNRYHRVYKGGKGNS